MEIRYRAGQFWRLLRPESLPPAALADVAAVLSAAELALFQQQAGGDQWHSYHVYCTVRDAGHNDHDLFVAALLHDVGKTRAPLTVWERSLIVLVQFLWPRRIGKWGAGAPRGWKRPFVVKTKHPAWGAEMAAQAGSSPRAVSLIRRHQDVVPGLDAGHEDELLRLLQWADDQN